jgi:hypothetical protein
MLTRAALISLLRHDRDGELTDEYPPVLICGSLAATLTVGMDTEVGWVLKFSDRVVYLAPGQVAKVASAPHDEQGCGCAGGTVMAFEFHRNRQAG